jgi:hypothetical protein
VRRSVHGGDCVVLAGQRSPTLYSDALAELRAAQKAQAAYAAQAAARRRALAQPPSRPARAAARPLLTPSSPLASVLLAAARATLSRERLHALRSGQERESIPCISPVSPLYLPYISPISRL